MSSPVKRHSVTVRLAVALATLGGIFLVASFLTAYLIADHSSSDSSISSQLAIGLGALGLLAVLLGAALYGGIALTRLWRRAQADARGGA